MKRSKETPTLSYLIESFFTQYLVAQRHVSPHTVASYRDTFRLLLPYAAQAVSCPLHLLRLEDLDADRILAFLGWLEQERGVTARSRNQRLSAIKSFFRHVGFKLPERAQITQRVLCIAAKRHHKRVVNFLTPEEVTALLKAPNLQTWVGRRDHALLLLAIQTGLRASELTGLKRENLTLYPHAYINCQGKGRKERSTPLTRQTVASLREWLKEGRSSQILFPNQRGTPLTTDGIQYLLDKYRKIAEEDCPRLKYKQLSPHVLRHTAAMQLLLAGVDRAVIALWLGHQSVETTQVYLEANLTIKEQMLAKTAPHKTNTGRYRASPDLMKFLCSL
jgi:integrase/recombinase XerD